MRGLIAFGLAALAAWLLIFASPGFAIVEPQVESQEEGNRPLAHMVFFSLKDRSDAACERFVQSCHRFLAGHKGVTYFSVGVIAKDIEESVNVRDFDVALHLVFQDKAAADVYQESDRHQQFIEANRDQFEKVRVFDSYLIQ